jgi:hypothetical protein
MLPVLLAAALAAASGADAVDDEDQPVGDDRSRLSITAWGGEVFATGTRVRSAPLLGVEAAWAFDAVELGILGQAYRLRPTPARDWSPVVLARLTERFDTRKGIEASLSFGAGAGRLERWVAWYQVALGVRMELGPMFVSGEIGFEQYDLVRLVGGVGFRL